MRNKLSNLKTVFCSLLLLAWAGSVQAQSVVVDFVPTPLNSIVNEGDNFAVTIEVQANGQATAGAEIHLDFDPTYLEVVSFTSGTTLPIPIIGPLSDNLAGTIDYAAGTFSTSPPTGTFALLTINFLAKAVVSSTSVTYNTVFPRATAASISGSSVLDEAIPFTVTINALCDLVSSGLSNIQCNDNGTPSNPSDDYFTFDLNPTGTNLGAGYSVSNVSGTSTGVYGGVSSFATAPGTAGNGDLIITITDNSALGCTLAETVTDPGSCSSGSPLTLILGSESEFACGSILIPVTVENYTDILGGQGTISWNNAVVNYVGTQQYGIPDLSSGSFNTQPGQLIFSYNDPTIDQLGHTLPDGSVLFVIEFAVVGTLGSTTSLDFTNAGISLAFFDLALNAVPSAFVSGSVDVPASTNLTGQAVSEQGSTIQGVTFSLSGGDGPLSQTGNPGFDFTITPCAADEVGAFKNNDVDVDNGINTLDIIFIQRHILGIAPFVSPYKLIAADVNTSSSINVLDILFVRQMVLQQRTKFPEPGGSTGLADGNRLWAFVPSDYVFANPTAPWIWPLDTARVYPEIQSRTGQDFIGMKLGDVNDSWNSGVLRMAAVDEVTFDLAEVNGLPGGEVVIPVAVKDFDQLTGFQFTMNWDPSLLGLNEVINRDLTVHVGTQMSASGKLTVSWNDPAGQAVTLADGSVVFELRMSLNGSWGSVAAIELSSELTASEAYDDALELVSIVSDAGTVHIGDATTGIDPSLNNGYGLFQNIPNPFDESTLLVFELPKGEEVEIRIFNALGQEIRMFKDSYAAGVHELKWDGTSAAGLAVSEGIYYAKMQAGTFSGTVRMQKLK